MLQVSFTHNYTYTHSLNQWIVIAGTCDYSSDMNSAEFIIRTRKDIVYLLRYGWLLCDSMDYSLPGSPVHGISQPKILEWVAISFSRGSPPARDWTYITCLAGRFFTTEPQGKRPLCNRSCSMLESKVTNVFDHYILHSLLCMVDAGFMLVDWWIYKAAIQTSY